MKFTPLKLKRSMSIPSRVKSIIGITESDLVKLGSEERLEYICADSFVHSFDYHVTPIGQFQTVKLADLKELVGDNDNSELKCPLEVKDAIDVGVLQSTLKSSDKTMVQVASNFNCLEVPSRYSFPDCGDLVEEAHTDCTQGPAACFGPLAAYLYRAHFYDGGQIGNKQVNLLRNTASFFGTPINGKLTLDGSEKSIGNTNDVADLVEVGLHTNAAIIFGRNENGLNYELDEPYPIIDQIFSASINLNDYGKKTSKDNLTKINRTLLRAAYESAYLAAIYRKRKVLYLTLVGGGVFGNPIPMILEEIVRAHKCYTNNSNSELRRVVLCIYEEGTSVPSDISKMMNN